MKDQIGSLEKVIYLGTPNDDHPKNTLFDEVISLGRKRMSDHPTEVENLKKDLHEDDYANICYTSGTTADPKGIILSHKNYVANVHQAYTLMDIPDHFKTLLILPWDHAFAHTAGIYAFMGKGASVAAVEIGNTPMETLRNIPQNIKQIKPHLLMSVPALAKNFKKNIEKGIRDKGELLYKLFQHALKISYQYNREGYNKGIGFDVLKKPLITLYDKILFSKIRENFGGNLKFFIGGGALLDIELQRFFYAIGIPMYQGYGLSEASPVISSNSEHSHKLGSSGYLVDNMELRICDDEGNALPIGEKGEIVIKGDNVMMGYWNNEEATNESIKVGWLYTGDLGYMDEDGFLYVLGRFKSLLIADDGEKYSPEGIEEALIQLSPFIDQVMLYNNQNAYTTALFVANDAAIKKHFDEHDLKLDAERIIELLENEIQKFKKGGEYDSMFPERWLPASFAVLQEGFTEQNKFLNSTMKMVRPKITEHYQDLIDFMYGAEGKNPVNRRNIYNLDKLMNL
jgi:long-chain acyl-CoA synthetase